MKSAKHDEMGLIKVFAAGCLGSTFLSLKKLFSSKRKDNTQIFEG